MKMIFQIAWNLLWFGYVPYKIYLMVFGGKKHKLKKSLKHLRHTIKIQLKINSDLYSEQELDTLQKKLVKLDGITFDDLGKAERRLEEIESRLHIHTDRFKKNMVGELTDTLVIAFAVAFGVRALYAQPFKIPTGSMQPTLYGIHLTEGENNGRVGKLEALFNYINYSWRYPALLASVPSRILYQGKVQYNDEELQYPYMENVSFGGYALYKHSNIRLGMTSLTGTKFLQNGVVPETYTVTEDTNELTRFYLHYLSSLNGRTFQKNENILNVRHTTGDHIFVNRLAYYFSEPKRGDVAVFVTDGFRGMAGRYYIKRLVGMPGDTLKVVDGKLMVKEKGRTQFRTVDKGDHIGFERMYSGQGGYRGYSNAGCFDSGRATFHFDERDGTPETYKQMPFVAKNGTFTVPEAFYFMMGDNSYNSRDSRYFGPVPRENLMGKALFCWWPFSRRWGVVDTAEPDTASRKIGKSDFDQQ